MVLAIFVIPIKVDGMDLAARVHLVTKQDLKPALCLTKLKECGSGKKCQSCLERLVKL